MALSPALREDGSDAPAPEESRTQRTPTVRSGLRRQVTPPPTATPATATPTTAAASTAAFATVTPALSVAEMAEAALPPTSETAELPTEDRATRQIALVRTHLAAVWRFLRRLGLSPEDADDATQEVLLAAVQKIDRVSPGLEKRFAFGIALRLASRKRRAARAHADRTVPFDGETVASGAQAADQLLERQEKLAQLDRALAELGDELRPTFVLYELEEMTMAEIAHLTDTPAGTVASRLRRGREEFQKITRRMQKRQP